MNPEQRIEFTSDGNVLEGALRVGEGALAALVLHPHPLYGGEMDNHVVKAICDVLAAEGATTLRFSFRGAGRSEGEHDGGRGESADARAAAACLRESTPEARFLLAGYSFGAFIAAAVADSVSADALVLVSLPVAAGATPVFDAARPTMLVTGELDSVAPPDGLVPLASPRCRVEVVGGADHGWWPGVTELASIISGFSQDLPPVS
jgi:hypothetical protein